MNEQLPQRHVMQAIAFREMQKMQERLARLKSGASMHYTAAGHINGDPQAPMTARCRSQKQSLRRQQAASRRANRG